MSPHGSCHLSCHLSRRVSCRAEAFASRRHAGFSIIGLLIAAVCMVVLFSILMTSLNKSVTGEKTQQEGTVRSFEDKMYLLAMHQSLVVHAVENRDQFIVPSRLQQNDATQNTTANLFSAMVMQNMTPCTQLISGNEYSGFVEEKLDYNFAALNPSRNVHWDASFKGDLARLSNVSFAHVPLHGERLKKHWTNTLSSTSPVMGNRGPKDGVNGTQFMSCGKDGIWRGHLVFGDGHVDFIDTATPGFLGANRTGQGAGKPDNLFSMDDGPNGLDAVIAVTRTMTSKGPELQFD